MKKIDQKKRMLITVSVMGSCGSLRFIVDEDERVCSVIASALKRYAREGRLPALGSSDESDFQLYCAAFDDDLSPSAAIGFFRCRDFMLHKKKKEQPEKGDGRKRSSGQNQQHPKAWFKKLPDPGVAPSFVQANKIPHYFTHPIIPIWIPVCKKPRVEEEARSNGDDCRQSMEKKSGNLKGWFRKSNNLTAGAAHSCWTPVH